MYLSRVRIKNLALVEELDVEFSPGIIAVTGETGAGKSMILGSLELLLGQRADSSSVRKGAKKAIIEGVFISRIPAHPADKAVRSYIQEQGYDLEADEPLIIRREISAEGRSSAHVAGRTVTMRELADVTAAFVTIHSQHEQQSLSRRAWQRGTLDSYASADALADDVRAAYQSWKTAENEYNEWIEREREQRRREDLLRHQMNEIRNAQLHSQEEEELLAQENTLTHAEELQESADSLHHLLSDEESGIIAQLHQAQRNCARIFARDKGEKEWDELLSAALANITELEQETAAYVDSLESDPSALARVEERLHLIEQLKKKYGDTIDDILAYCAQIEQELEETGSFEEKRDTLEKRRDDAYAAVHLKAEKLTQLRIRAAKELSELVEKELAPLGMSDARFIVQITPTENITAHGAEDIEFLISTNLGEDPKPLRKIASGGEMSRIMLALKCIATDEDDVVVLVFDEIDAGISGTVAHAVGERLQALEDHHQVFVITHMPQIACRASGHYTVEKTVEDARTRVSITQLAAAAREEEIARMLGGDTTAARRHARELCEKADTARKKNTNPKKGKTQ